MWAVTRAGAANRNRATQRETRRTPRQLVGRPLVLWGTRGHRFVREPSAFAVRKALCRCEWCEHLEQLWAIHLFPGPELAHKLDTLRRHCDAVDRDYASIEKTSRCTFD